MTCRRCEKELSAWIDGELSALLAAQVEAHLQGCATCRARASTLRVAAEAVDRLPQLEPSAAFAAGFRSKLQQARREQRATREPRRPWWRLSFALASAAAAAGLVAVLVRSPRSPQPNELELARNIELLQDYEVVTNLDVLENYEVIAGLDSLGEGRP